MCDYDVNGVPIGVVNDFDLATWVHHSTTNNDRTGTIPFMAIDLLEGGLEDRIPRLYRHDLESFSWILAYISVAEIEYEDSRIKISPVGRVNTWFKDRDRDDRESHISSKMYFHMAYGKAQIVSDRYHCYLPIIRRITRYWSEFHDFKAPEEQVGRPTAKPTSSRKALGRPPLGKPTLQKSEDDDSARSLTLFIKSMEGVGEGFKEVKTNLRKAVKAPKAVTMDVV